MTKSTITAAREEGRREGLKLALRISTDSALASEVWTKIVHILGGEMSHKSCETCAYESVPFDHAPCDTCCWCEDRADKWKQAGEAKRATDPDSETELRRMITKAIDDAWTAGLEKGKATGKIEGRLAGIEESISTIQRAAVYDLGDIVQMSRKLRELLEAK